MCLSLVRRCWWVALCVGVVAALLVPVPHAGAVAGYGDVGEDSYYTDPVQWSVDNDLTGITGTCFAPDAAVTRGETAGWMWRMEDQPLAPAHSFDDVTVAEQQNPVSWMSNIGITTGTTATTFSPNKAKLTRAELATFLWRLADSPAAPAHSFEDVLKGWQQGPVSWMSSTGITTGTSPTTFSPDDTLTRAQLITFLYRYNNNPIVTADPTTPQHVTQPNPTKPRTPSTLLPLVAGILVGSEPTTP